MGYRYREFAGFAIAMEEAAELFDESLEVMRKAWTSDAPWSHLGSGSRARRASSRPPT
jgi:alkanesulfonate monooxygenase SsuD/methylene tetrahydromethanopterin reductase-like flavin-dependent oxidoreductase (luciferase family)